MLNFGPLVLSNRAVLYPRPKGRGFRTGGFDNNYHRYFPDFVIVKNTGEFYIVEIKSESERGDPTVVAKEKAVERLKNLQPDAHFEYKVIYTRNAFLQENLDEMQTIREWIYGNEPLQNDSENNSA